MKHKITILGGTDGFGLWLGQYIDKKFSSKVQITLTGRDAQKCKQVQEKTGWNVTQNNIEAVQDADIVIFCIPIHQTQSLMQELAPYVKKQAIIIDVTSVKQMPAQTMQQYYKEHICIPTHPMFGPYVPEIAGQIVVLTPDEQTKDQQSYMILKKFLQDEGVKVVEVTPQENDRMMAVVQGLTHYNMFVIGNTLKTYDFDMLSSLDFVSPVYKMMIASVARYIGQNPTLYADIQMYNPEILKIHKIFSDSANEFNRLVEKKDRPGFVKMVEEIRAFMTQEACDFGQQYTDKIIYLLTHQKKLMGENMGKKISIKNIYTQENITGILEGCEEEKILLDGKQYDENIWVISDIQ